MMWGCGGGRGWQPFVSDFGCRQDTRFDSAGNLTGSWGEKGSLGYELDGPT